ncbi:MAG: helix-turn-helix transcriptional regulator [Oscillospiraceae bacterium]|nr:helix-turn-helix transcriptional regulator [Oscillospiraceae bacterium]
MTQKNLADRIGVTKSVVSFYELRERTPSPEVLVKLATIFHVSSDYLLGIEKGKHIDISGLDSDDEKAVRAVVEQLRKKNQK